MPGPDNGPAGALRLLRDVAVRRAGHELRGDPPTLRLSISPRINDTIARHGLRGQTQKVTRQAGG
ncbi:hypothetical protein bAD24_III05780 [Burkholderia sp. AD24]|nr:hypothetical protein bAD24_III05780 [Burkholderia sp. AD24]